MTEITWTKDLVDRLRKERKTGKAITECAATIRICYPVTLRKCQELGISGRVARGRRAGTDIVADRTKARRHMS